MKSKYYAREIGYSFIAFVIILACTFRQNQMNILMSE